MFSFSSSTSRGRFVFEKTKNEREFSLSLTLARLLVDNPRRDVIYIYSGIRFANRSTGVLLFLALPFLFFSSNLYFTEVWHDHTFHMTVAGSQAHAHVTGLRPAVSYQFRIYAENELGRSQASDVSIPRFNTMSSLSLSLNQTSFPSLDPERRRFIREIDIRASKRVASNCNFLAR